VDLEPLPSPVIRQKVSLCKLGTSNPSWDSCVMDPTADVNWDIKLQICLLSWRLMQLPVVHLQSYLTSLCMQLSVSIFPSSERVRASYLGQVRSTVEDEARN
jgi:hypothetical protein